MGVRGGGGARAARGRILPRRDAGGQLAARCAGRNLKRPSKEPERGSSLNSNSDDGGPSAHCTGV